MYRVHDDQRFGRAGWAAGTGMWTWGYERRRQLVGEATLMVHDSESPRVDRGPALVVSDFGFDAPDRERVETALGAGRLLLVRSNDELPGALAAHPECDVLCTFRPPSNTLQLAPNLRWLAMPSAGADGALRAGLVRPDGGPIVTTANGVHAVPISEYVFSVMLTWARHWPDMLALQRERTWADHKMWMRLAGGELHGSTLGIIGLGAIGRQVARLGRAFGMRIIAARRTASPSDTDPDVDELVPLSGMERLFSEADYLVLAVPATPQTRHLIGTDALRAMKPSAFLVNIARGSIVDEAALVEALRTGAIAGAGLDVTAEEPLPSDSPLWTLPNVLLSPHVSGATSRYSRRFTDLFLRNLALYRAAQPMINVVQAERGY